MYMDINKLKRKVQQYRDEVILLRAAIRPRWCSVMWSHRGEGGSEVSERECVLVLLLAGGAGSELGNEGERVGLMKYLGLWF